MRPNFRLKSCIGALLGIALASQGSAQVAPVPMALSDLPLFMSINVKPNVLLVMDNSNSMDEAADGHAVGSASPDSKSEIARQAAMTLIGTFGLQTNIGLMAYQQSGVVARHVWDSTYDASFDPANYNPAFAGSRASQTKRFRKPNPWNPANFIYYNVALPEYNNDAGGSQLYYSPTADARPTPGNPDGFSGGANAIVDPWGPWNSYYVLDGKTDTNDDALIGAEIPNTGVTAVPGRVVFNRNMTTWAAGAGPGAALNCPNLPAGAITCYFFYPTDSDVAQGITDFGRWMVSEYVGPTWFANGSPGLGYLHVPIAPVDAAQRTRLLNKLAVSQFADNQPTNAAFPLQNAGETPMAGTLNTANDYFNGRNASFGAAQGNVAGLAPLPQSCNKNFVVFLTDGLPSTTAAGAAVANPAAGLAEVVANAAALRASAAAVDTYMIGFALPYGANPAQLDGIAAAGGTGAAYFANNPATLVTALSGVFSNILARSGAASALTANMGRVTAGTVIYQAKFDSTDWRGSLLAISMAGGALASSGNWEAGAQLPAFSTRKNHIATYSPANKGGIPFSWSYLDAAQRSALDNDSTLLDYIAGDGSKEGAGAAQFRPRTVSKLGDIVNSAPVYVGKPPMSYRDSIESAPYSVFVRNNATRTPMLYVGANDGMLHGFNATTGVETFAYVPSQAFANLSQLARQDYSHRFYVDGSPFAADAYIKTPLTGGVAAWRTILVGGLNAGGQGIYALDITAPADPSIAVQNRVLWEFTDRQTGVTSTTVNYDADMGYSFSEPTIVKTRAGWVAIFGNGYNNFAADGAVSATGNAALYVVNLETGVLLKKFDTGSGMNAAGKPNGLSSPYVVDIDGDAVADYAYAGDLNGNLWKFDLTDASSAAWSVAYGGLPLFTARSGSGQIQAITAKPIVGKHPKGGYMVYFGTGKSIESGDNTLATGNSFYAIWDNGGAVSGGRASLLQQTVDAQVSAGGKNWRITSANAPQWTAATPGATAHKGWYLDLPTALERAITAPKLDRGRIIFTTTIPSPDPCSSGATGWEMELDAISGGRTADSSFDTNGDGAFDAADFLTLDGANVPASGVAIAGGPSSPLILGGPPPQGEPPPGCKGGVVIMNTSTGTPEWKCDPPGGSASKSRSWREIR